MLQLSFSSVLTRRHLTHNGSRIRNSCCATRALEGRRSRHARVLLLCSSSEHAARLSALLAAPAAYCSLVFCLASSVLPCAHTPRRRATPLRRGSTSIEAAAELGQLLEGLAEVLLGLGLG